MIETTDEWIEGTGPERRTGIQNRILADPRYLAAFLDVLQCDLRKVWLRLEVDELPLC